MTHRRQNFMGGAAILAGAVAVTKLLGALYKIPLGNLLDRAGHGAFLRRVQHLQSAAGAVYSGTAGGPEPHGVPCRRPAALWRRAPLPAPGPGPAGGAGAGVLRRYVSAAGGPGRRTPRSGRRPRPCGRWGRRCCWYACRRRCGAIPRGWAIWCLPPPDRWRSPPASC